VTARFSKPYIFKAPPSLDFWFAAQLSYEIEVRTAKTVDPKKDKVLNIDLSEVTEFDSLGVALFASGIAKRLNDRQSFECRIVENRSLGIFGTHTRSIARKIQGALRCLGVDTLTDHNLLTIGDTLCTDTKLEPIQTDDAEFLDYGILISIPTSIPEQRAEVCKDILNKLRTFLSAIGMQSGDRHVIVPIIREIIRNTIDHAKAPGLIGLKPSFLNEKLKKLDFVTTDLGIGVSASVRKFIELSAPNERRVSKDSAADLYHWAFSEGHTTKPKSGTNAGGLRLYMFDAYSMLNVSDFPLEFSHSKVRRRLFHTVTKPCFYFKGEFRIEH
jgi:hypothetical protein